MIKFRAQKDSDKIFLYELYVSTRAEEMRLTAWDNEQLELFLQFQFNAQFMHYLNAYKDAAFDIVMIDGKDVGRLYVNISESEIRLIDISFLPEYRGKGYGSKILENLLNKGQELNKIVRLSVLKNNPAEKLYHRLGFVKTIEEPPYIKMEKLPL